MSMKGHGVNIKTVSVRAYTEIVRVLVGKCYSGRTESRVYAVNIKYSPRKCCFGRTL